MLKQIIAAVTLQSVLALVTLAICSILIYTHWTDDDKFLVRVQDMRDYQKGLSIAGVTLASISLVFTFGQIVYNIRNP